MPEYLFMPKLHLFCFHQSRVLFSSHILLFSAVNSKGKETCKCVNDHPNCQASWVVETAGMLFRMRTLFIMSRLSLGILAYVVLQLFLADTGRQLNFPRWGRKPMIWPVTDVGFEAYWVVSSTCSRKLDSLQTKELQLHCFLTRRPFLPGMGLGLAILGWSMEVIKLNLIKL